jgi:hypothetical protein
MSLATLVGTGFLLAQFVSILYEQTRPTRYWCWAPNDYVTDYLIEVSIDGRTLSDEAVLHRYRWRSEGRLENVPRHLIDIIRQYEQTYGRDDGARVHLRYRVNGHAAQEWQWPAA